MHLDAFGRRDRQDVVVLHAVNLERFAHERGDAWSDLDALVETAGRRPERLGAANVRRLGELYRAAAADLSLARTQWPGDPVTLRLEQRVGRARHLVYDAPTRRESLRAFITRDYWQAVRKRKLELAIAAVLLFGSAGLSGLWADRDPGAAAGVVPGAYQAVTHRRPHGADLRLSAGERTGISGEIFTNNIRVTLLAFAAGVAAGVGTALLLIVNGVMLGVVAGLAVGSGNGRVFFELVTAHGLLELSCIVVAAAAGLRMGWALVEPGSLKRTTALGREAREAMKVVLGTAPWLVVAGLIEGFLTPAGLGLPAVLAIGIAAAGAYWSLVLVLGRTRARDEPEPSSAGTP
jgi:uncharacterized membrane protein SpoIIM required for sporulation